MQKIEKIHFNRRMHMDNCLTFDLYLLIYTLSTEIEHSVFSNIDLFGASGLVFYKLHRLAILVSPRK